MYHPQEFNHKSEAEIIAAIKHLGFDPLKIRNAPKARYPEHSHPEEKVLVFLEGSMEVTVDHQLFHCKTGDQLIIPGNKSHSAIAGPQGCTFLWAEKRA
jgi:mannose-6-phosphate isomerase-like protein (cupin superfamily)